MTSQLGQSRREREAQWSLVRPAARMAGVVFPDLTGPERLVCEAFPRGEWVDLREPGDTGTAGSWGPQREIRAGVLRALLLGAGETEPGYTPAIRLRGAWITGRLDLMGATVNWPLVCEYCEFESGIRFVEAITRTVRITGSRMPSFNGTRMRLDGILNLWRCVIGGVLRLDQAKITGEVCLRGTQAGAVAEPVPEPGAGAEAVAASGLTVDGGVECTGLIANGSVSLRTAKITGAVDLSGARVSCPGEHALAMDNAEIGGRLDCGGVIVDGELSLHNATVAGSVVLAGARLRNPGAEALSAGGVTIGGGAFLTEDFTAAGEIRLVGARLQANLTLAGASVSNPGGVAVNLDRAAIQVCHAEEMTCAGRFSLSGARIGAELGLRGAQLDGGEGIALAADNAVIDGRVALGQVRAHGEVNLRNAQVGRVVLITDAVLENPGGTACRLSGATVAGDVLCGGLTTRGGFRMTGARIGGGLNLDRVRLDNGAADALSARALQAAEIIFRPAAPVRGSVDFSHARVEIFRDDPACWPEQIRLDGLAYQALEPRLPARERLRWLTRDPGGHQPQPYQQLAAHYTGTGQPAQARAVLLARERRQRRALPLLPRVWGILQDVTLGYGYQPWRALAWLAAALAAGTVLFTVSPPHALTAGAPPFHAFVYTLDLLLPVVDLGLKHAYSPDGLALWLSYLLVAAGWVLVTTVAAAAARVLTRR